MCGILGIINRKTSKEEAEGCLKRLIHRGPDGGNIWQDGEEEGSRVTLGHRRLSILDLSDAGSQPMVGPMGRYVLVYNGEIYNFLEIRDELIRKGYSFVSDSDSEVLLLAYIEWGSECLNRFNGMWAFAVWDREKRELFMSRDRFGVKPLFYTWLDTAHTKLAFASEMKALMPIMDEVKPNRKIVMDPERMTLYESTSECVIEGIHRFPAASYGVFNADAKEPELKIKRFYHTLENLKELPDTYEEKVLQFRELFLDAVKLRMRSDVTIGTALSGGLDSSATICAMAQLAKNNPQARMNKDWQHAFVAAFPGTTMDESAYARCVTDYLGINSTEVVIDPSKAVDRLNEYLYLFEDVYLTSPIPMMELYHALRENGTYVTIDGHGADELFGGYTFDFINALKDAGRSKADRNMILDAYIGSFPDDGTNISLKNRSRSAVLWQYRKRQLKKKLRGDKGKYEIKSRKEDGFDRLDTLNQILYVSTHETILPTLLRNYDHYSMASGIEIRMPFMDYRVVEYAFSLGWRDKLHGGFSKSIIRDAMAPYMPKEIAYRRTKIGFNTPIVEWMKGPMREYFTDTINSADFAGCDLIDPDAVRKKVMQVITDPAATFAQGETAFSSLYPYLWEKAVLKA